MLQMPTWLDFALNWGGILGSLVIFLPALAALAAMIGLIPVARVLPPVILGLIIAASCTVGGFGVGTNKGALVEREIWEEKIRALREQRENDRIEAEKKLSAITRMYQSETIERERAAQQSLEDISEALKHATVNNTCLGEPVPERLLDSIR